MPKSISGIRVGKLPRNTSYLQRRLESPTLPFDQANTAGQHPRQVKAELHCDCGDVFSSSSSPILQHKGTYQAIIWSRIYSRRSNHDIVYTAGPPPTLIFHCHRSLQPSQRTAQRGGKMCSGYYLTPSPIDRRRENPKDVKGHLRPNR